MKKHLLLLMTVFCLSELIFAKSMIRRSKHVSNAFVKTTGIDKALRITFPLLGTKVIGNIWIKGNAKAGSWVQLTVSSTYFKLGTDQQKRKIFKAEGPLKGDTRVIKVRTDGQGFWSTNSINFRNRGWSEQFKIVVTSVEGKNSTYVTVTNDTKPVIAWD